MLRTPDRRGGVYHSSIRGWFTAPPSRGIGASRDALAVPAIGAGGRGPRAGLVGRGGIDSPLRTDRPPRAGARARARSATLVAVWSEIVAVGIRADGRGLGPDRADRADRQARPDRREHDGRRGGPAPDRTGRAAPRRPIASPRRGSIGARPTSEAAEMGLARPAACRVPQRAGQPVDDAPQPGRASLCPAPSRGHLRGLRPAGAVHHAGRGGVPGSAPPAPALRRRPRPPGPCRGVMPQLPPPVPPFRRRPVLQRRSGPASKGPRGRARLSGPMRIRGYETALPRSRGRREEDQSSGSATACWGPSGVLISRPGRRPEPARAMIAAIDASAWSGSRPRS